MNNLRNIDDSLLVLNDNDIKKLFLYGNDLFDGKKKLQYIDLHYKIHNFI